MVQQNMSIEKIPMQPLSEIYKAWCKLGLLHFSPRLYIEFCKLESTEKAEYNQQFYYGA
jgi:hypothetical protein